MKYNIRKNWAESYNLIVKKPIVLLPFIIVAFLEFLALELIYFSSRSPLVKICGPIVRKFYGEAFLHYPGNLVLLPKLLYYAQTLIYMFCGVMLLAITVNIVRNIKLKIILKRNVLVRNAFRRYLTFFSFGLLVAAAMFLVKRLNLLFYAWQWPPFMLAAISFILNVILQTLLVLVIPIIVIRKKLFFRALGAGLVLAGRNFPTLLILISLPFLIYLPISLLKIGLPKLMEMTFPEIILLISAAGIILGALAECFIIVSATQFLLDTDKKIAKP